MKTHKTILFALVILMVAVLGYFGKLNSDVIAAIVGGVIGALSKGALDDKEEWRKKAWS